VVSSGINKTKGKDIYNSMDKFYKKCEICSSLIPIDEKEKVSDAAKRQICSKCAQDGWKFTKHGVLMNETPVRKKKKKAEDI